MKQTENQHKLISLVHTSPNLIKHIFTCFRAFGEHFITNSDIIEFLRIQFGAFKVHADISSSLHKSNMQTWIIKCTFVCVMRWECAYTVRLLLILSYCCTVDGSLIFARSNVSGWAWEDSSWPKLFSKKFTFLTSCAREGNGGWVVSIGYEIVLSLVAIVLIRQGWSVDGVLAYFLFRRIIGVLNSK